MLAKDFAKTVVHDAETSLTVAISPCCWMYPNYPFQIQGASDFLVYRP